MSNKRVSTVATDVIASYGNTAIQVIKAYRTGGERVLDLVDRRFEAAVKTGATRLSADARSNLISAERRVKSYYAKGLQYGTERAEDMVHAAVGLASKGVARAAVNAKRLDQATKLGALEAINRIALPAATAVSEVAGKIEVGSRKLAKRVAGKPATVKTVGIRRKAAKKTVAAKKAEAVKRTVSAKKAVAVKKTVAARKTVARKARAATLAA